MIGLLVLAISLAVGGATGFVATSTKDRDRLAITAGEAESQVETLAVFLDGNARDLSRNASTSDATELRKRLLEQAAGLDKLCQSRTLGEFTPMLEMELGYRHVQLALLEEKEDLASSDKHMQKAEQIFCSLGWRDCSRARLRIATEHRLAHLKRFADKSKGGQQ